jgi:hypothetical protein
MSTIFDIDSNTCAFPCPHCSLYIQVHLTEVNCQIFRHGAMKIQNVLVGPQLDPHTPEEQCNKLIRDDLIYGCGKPYELYQSGSKWRVRKCDYRKKTGTT